MQTKNSHTPSIQPLRAVYVFLVAFGMFTSVKPLAAQQNIVLSPSVLPVQGGHAQQGNFALSYTIGESVQTTLQNNGLMLTGGFQQPEILPRNDAVDCGMINYLLRGGSYSECANCSTIFNSITNPSDLVNDERFLPDSNTVTKRIGINLIFLRNSNGEGGFADDSVTDKYFSDVMSVISWHYSGANEEDTAQYCLDGAGRNAKISFEIMHKYYINNTHAWNNTNNSSYYCPENSPWYLDSLDAAIDVDVNYKKGINVFFTEYKNGWEMLNQSPTALATNLNTTACSEFSTCDLSKRLSINMPNYFLQFENQKRQYPVTPPSPNDTFFDPSLPLSSWSPPYLNKYWDKVDALANGLSHELGHCLFNELHHVSCKNNLMNHYFEPRNYLRKCDLEEIHQTLSMFSLREYLVGCPYSPHDPYIVSTDEVIDYDFKTWRDIVIEPNATLTITCTVRMPNQGKIVVKPGAKLYVNGGTITNACDSMWEGIIVKGNKTQVQDLSTTNNATAMSTHQGFVYLLDATIENAHEAIRVWNPDDGWVNESINSPQGGTGGIIRAVNTTFKNNRRSAEFMWYQSKVNGREIANKSYFRKCTFITDDNHNEAYPFSAHATAWGVKDVEFAGCSFENNRTDTDEETPDYTLGSGIIAIDAGINVHNYTTSGSPWSTNRSAFKNLQQGVYVAKTHSPYTTKVLTATFENCLRGIRSEGVDNAILVGNHFTMGGNPANITNSLLDYDEGITLNGNAFGFRVEQDTFVRTGSNNDISIGIRANETGPNENKIYKNQFNSVTIGNLANRQNQDNTDPLDIKGLKYECNINTDNTWFDIISLDDQQGGQPAGIKTEQGSLSKSAGNSFCQLGSPFSASDFGNSTVPLTYYHHGSQTHGNKEWPEFKSSSVDAQTYTSVFTNTCGTNFSGPVISSPPVGPPNWGCISCLSYSDYSTAFSEHRVLAENYRQTYLDLIDGGNTQARLTEVDTTTNADSLKLHLLSFAPNLSSRILDSVVLKYSLLDTTAQYQIFKANAEGVSYHVMQEWIKWVHPPQWMRDSVNAAKDSLTYRSYLLDTLLFHQTEKELALQSILLFVIEDTAGLDLELYRTWLDSAEGLWAKREMVNTYLHEGRLDTIEALLAFYDTTAIRSVEDSISFSNYKEYAKNYSEWMMNDSSMMHLSSANLAELQGVSEGNEHRKGTQIARQVLSFFYDGAYFTPPLLPEVQTGKRDENEEQYQTPIIPKVIKQFISAPSLKLYPNPSQNTITIEYNGFSENTKLYLLDVMGRVIEGNVLKGVTGKIEVNTSSYQNGIYLARTETEEHLIIKSKFIIQK